MDSTSPAGGSASEELQRAPAATSLESATPVTQATKVHHQSIQQGDLKEDVQTRDLTKLEVTPESSGSASAGAQARTKEGGQASTNDIKDNVSILSVDQESQRLNQPLDFRIDVPYMTVDYQQNRAKYARAAAIYTEGLENRVSTVEKDLLELQYELGSKERPSEEGRQVICNIPNLEKGRAFVLISLSHSSDDTSILYSPCTNPLPLKSMRLSLKDWKDGHHHDKWGKASIFMATNTGTSSFQPRSIDPSSHSQKTLQPNDKGANYDSGGHTADVRRPGPPDIARLKICCPWPMLLLEILSGQPFSSGNTWIYPFKHFVFYETRIRKFVELLNETNVDGFEAKDLSRSLSRIISEVVRILEPERDDVEYSDIYISNFLQRKPFLNNHHAKVRMSFPEDLEDELEDDDKADHGLSSNFPVDDPVAKVSERSNIAPEVNPPQEQYTYMCTCLKDARDQLQLLVNIMDSHLGSLLILRNAIRDRVASRIRFEHLWHLFQPGDVVVTSRQPCQAYRVIHVSGGRPLLTTDIVHGHEDAEAEPTLHRQSHVSLFNIDCVKFDFDGEKFGPVQDTISITEYEEERIITKLDVYPISYAEEEELSRTLLDRGRRFAGYHDFQHKRYEGLSLTEPQEEIEGEVIVDFTQSFRQPENAIHKPQIGLQRATIADVREVYEDHCSANKSQCMRMNHNCLVDDTEFDKQQMDRFLNVESRGMFLETRESSQTLTEDQLILLPYRVHGFSLRSRKWVLLDIDLLQDIKMNDSLDGQNSSFDDLVIPEEYKKIVKALVKSHALGLQPKSWNRQQIDLIRGKGKGLIILLHGVPGVGKISTAESVASYTGRPLFPITCGDIGQTAFDIEKNLEAIFLLARKWGCVLLLDEADVFLAKREKGGDNIDRNALISVFLRTLEYYSGILFLTTNRIGSFDEAFKSRIHVSLYYAPLSKSQTFEVWAMNLNRLSKSKRDIYVDRSEIEAFARNHWEDGKRWNGRQIRNAFQTAVALAEYEFQEKCQRCEQTGEKPPFKPALDHQHFKTVAKTSAEFDDYLQSVMHGQTHEQKAQVLEIRNDTYDPERGIDTPSGKKYSHQRAVRPRHAAEQPPVRENEAFSKTNGHSIGHPTSPGGYFSRR